MQNIPGKMPQTPINNHLAPQAYSPAGPVDPDSPDALPGHILPRDHDFRRRRSRDAILRLLAASTWASPADRALIHAVYDQGLSVEAVAAVRCQNPRTLRRHLHRVVDRLGSDAFAYIVRHRRGWSPVRRRIATACILEGLSRRQAAAALRLSLHRVRREMVIVEATLLSAGIELPTSRAPSDPRKAAA